jgi:hypothetical protein
MSCSKQATPALFDLPLPALALVLKFSKCLAYNQPIRLHHPLFLVSREGRDVAIQHSGKIKLKLDKSDNVSNSGPLARLLNRVCSQSGAKPELEIVLDAGAVPSKEQGELLASLLRPRAGCWPAVKKLTLLVSSMLACVRLLASFLVKAVSDAQSLSLLPCFPGLVIRHGSWLPRWTLLPFHHHFDLEWGQS